MIVAVRRTVSEDAPHSEMKKPPTSHRWRLLYISVTSFLALYHRYSQAAVAVSICPGDDR